MLNAIKQETTVLPNGVVPFRSPELKAGSRVEVIVILKEEPPLPQKKNMLSFMGKGKGAFTTPEEANAFIRQERDTWEK
jgi:hypothetical protein